MPALADRRPGSGHVGPPPSRVWQTASQGGASIARNPERTVAMAGRDELVDAIAGFAIFADLTTPQLEGVVGQWEEAWYPEGERILRQGLTGSGLFVILEGECSIRIDGEERARLGRGEFFGEGSILLGEPPFADVVALRPVRCLVLGGPSVQGFLLLHPPVMYRMMQVQARRLRNANRWRA
jgi:CRP-like cAMP-binding protein